MRTATKLLSNTLWWFGGVCIRKNQKINGYRFLA